MRLSHNAELLATFCTLGHIKIWDTESWQLLQQLRDTQVRLLRREREREGERGRASRAWARPLAEQAAPGPVRLQSKPVLAQNRPSTGPCSRRANRAHLTRPAVGRDLPPQEANIDEFFCGAFLPDGRHIVAGGKLKDRKRWSAQDEDNHILPCPLKVGVTRVQSRA